MSLAPDCAAFALRLRIGHLIFLGAEPFVQFRPPTPPRCIAHGDGHRLLLAHHRCTMVGVEPTILQYGGDVPGALLIFQSRA